MLLSPQKQSSSSNFYQPQSQQKPANIIGAGGTIKFSKDKIKFVKSVTTNSSAAAGQEPNTNFDLKLSQ